MTLNCYFLYCIGYVLSTAVPGSRFRIEDGYDVPLLANIVDFVNLEAFDLHNDKGSTVADHHAPLMKREKEKNALDTFLNVVSENTLF